MDICIVEMLLNYQYKQTNLSQPKYGMTFSDRHSLTWCGSPFPTTCLHFVRQMPVHESR